MMASAPVNVNYGRKLCRTLHGLAQRRNSEAREKKTMNENDSLTSPGEAYIAAALSYPKCTVDLTYSFIMICNKPKLCGATLTYCLARVVLC